MSDGDSFEVSPFEAPLSGSSSIFEEEKPRFGTMSINSGNSRPNNDAFDSLKKVYNQFLGDPLIKFNGLKLTPEKAESFKDGLEKVLFHLEGKIKFSNLNSSSDVD